MPEQQINITLGTAGHIDHGKTALVRLLTGCETDTLKEEKERGMSIELGFAPCKVSGLEVGIVDVPGHEHFIKTMVAGASGIDGVILVVAADDGIMPQTREHLDILTLLGVSHGIVALTKIDRVSPERVKDVTAELQRYLGGTFLEKAVIAPMSSVTGEGFDAFYPALVELVNSIEAKSSEGVFRLPVEKTFSIKGYGTVVTGIPVAGTVRVGDEVILLPQAMTGRVSAIQVYSREGSVAQAGQCAALNVRHWDHKAIARGNTLTLKGYFAPERWFLCKLRLLPKDGAYLKNATRVKFHTGTSETQAVLYLLEGDKLAPGQECFVQARLDEPLVAGPGDKFIVRSLSPVDTIGGGVIIEPIPRKIRRNRPGIVEEIGELADAIEDEAAFVEYAVKHATGGAATAGEIAVRTKMLPARLGVVLDQLCGGDRMMKIGGDLYAHNSVIESNEKRLVEILTARHDAEPEAAGAPADELEAALGLLKALFQAILNRVAADGRVVLTGSRAALAGYSRVLSPEMQNALESVEGVFRERLFAPPSAEEAARATGLSQQEAAKAISMLREQGALVDVPGGILFHKQAVERAREIVVEFFEREEQLESVKFKYLLDTTRKYAIPLLDHLDRIGVTLRIGNTRYLKGR